MRTLTIEKSTPLVEDYSFQLSPKSEEILVRVNAVALTPFDVNVTYDLTSFIRPPERKHGIGSSFSGHVKTIGNRVKNFKEGDAVLGFVMDPFHSFSGSEFICVPESVCTASPTRLSEAEAVSVVSDAMIAQRTLRLVKACDEDAILISGGCTPLTRALIQIAKSSMFGVEWVASTVRSLDEREYAESMGADETFDVSCNHGNWSVAFTKGVNRKQYDIVIDVTGESKQIKRLLKPGTGRLVSLFNKVTPMELLDFNSRMGSRILAHRIRFWLTSPFANLFTRCSGRMSYADGRYFSVIPSGDGEVLERIAVLMDTEILEPCVEKIVKLVNAPAAVRELRDNPFGLRGRIVVEF